MIDRPAGAGGVLYASGNANSGLSLLVSGERLVFDYNCFGDHHIAESQTGVPVGASVIGVRFRTLPGRTGRATLVIDSAESGHVDIPIVMLIISSIGPGVGYDHGSPVSQRYEGPFSFEGVLDRVEIQIRAGRAGLDSDPPAEEIASADVRQALPWP
ncbi:MAG TPA: hypothetical protein VFQ44_04820 [Streptosporangiaceae bacterium]|nr:hypothetical protein [Streptosporangiaceae bacterium]